MTLAPAHPERPLHALSSAALPETVVDAAASLPGHAPDAAFFVAPTLASERADALRSVLPHWAELAFAVKANGMPEVLAALAPAVDGFEVASQAELDAARAASTAAASRPRLLAAGPGKTPAFVEALVRAGADPVNVESRLELERVAAAARRAGRRARVALRINPEHVDVRGVLSMGGMPSQFGVPERDVPRLLAFARRLPEIDVIGFHVHAMSGNLDADAHVAYIASCLELARRLAGAAGVDLRLLDVGGGLGVAFDGGSSFDVDALGRGLHSLSPPAGVRVVLEPGRWIAAPCAWYAAPVMDLKRDGAATFAVLRGGIGHFALPASWDLVHRVAIVPVERWDEDAVRPQVHDAVVDLVGELCTPEDALARDVAVTRLRAGDVVVFPNAGAYGWEFALPRFLGHPPAGRLVIHTTPRPREGVPIA